MSKNSRRNSWTRILESQLVAWQGCTPELEKHLHLQRGSKQCSGISYFPVWNKCLNRRWLCGELNSKGKWFLLVRLEPFVSSRGNKDLLENQGCCSACLETEHEIEHSLGNKTDVSFLVKIFKNVFLWQAAKPTNCHMSWKLPLIKSCPSLSQ